MLRYNLVNLSDDVRIKIDCYGDWVRYTDYKNLLDKYTEVINELQSKEIHLISKHCWCKPTIEALEDK